jgi:hypothetical protein
MKVSKVVSKCFLIAVTVLLSLNIQAQSYVVDDGGDSDQGGGKSNFIDQIFLSISSNTMTLLSQIELSDGGFILAIHLEGPADLGDFYLENRGPQDLVLARIDAEGELIWFHQLGGAINMSWMHVDDNGNFSVAGQFKGRMQGSWDDFQSSGENDAFLARFSLDGGLDWAHHFTSRHSLAVHYPTYEEGVFEISLEVTQMKPHALLRLRVPTVINNERFRFNSRGDLLERYNLEIP